MGYHIRTGLVKEHESTLDMILRSLSKGEALRFPCGRPEEMNRVKYQFNRVLKATDVLINECDGRFKGIRQQVKVCEDWKNMAIVIEPSVTQAAGITSITPAEPNERDAIERLKQFEGQMDLIRFTPSPLFDLETWRSTLKGIGFDLMPDPDNPTDWIGGINEDGSAEYAVARIAKKIRSGFDMIGDM